MNDAEKKKLVDLLERIEAMEIKGVSIDSRRIKEGELFVAIKGDRFDGHDFVPEVMQKGAWGAIIDRSMLETQFGQRTPSTGILVFSSERFTIDSPTFRRAISRRVRCGRWARTCSCTAA